MNNLESVNSQISKKEVLEKLYPLLPKNLQNETCTFLENKNAIKIGNKLFIYHITKNDKIVFVERKRRHGETYDVLLTGNKIGNKTIKTKKGIVKNGKKVLLVCAGMLLIAMYQNNKAQEKDPLTISTVKENSFEIEIPRNLDHVVNELSYETEIEPIEEEKIVEETIPVNIEVVPTDYLGFEKRRLTEEKYGEATRYYAERRGLDAELVLNLFTRERYGERDKVRQTDLEEIGYKIFDKNKENVEEKMKQNIGQLTRAVCGEVITAPVFENGILVGQDKIYILPPCYDPYNIEDLKTLCVDERFSKKEQEMLLKAVELQTRGNCQIFKRKDAFYNVENNINVSTAYLSYVINKKHDLIRGVMSYNAGYGSVPDDMDYESILNGSIEAFDPYYIPKILQYASFKDGVYECTIRFKTGECVTYKFYNTRNLEEDYEKETGLSL